MASTYETTDAQGKTWIVDTEHGTRTEVVFVDGMKVQTDNIVFVGDQTQRSTLVANLRESREIFEEKNEWYEDKTLGDIMAAKPQGPHYAPPLYEETVSGHEFAPDKASPELAETYGAFIADQQDLHAKWQGFEAGDQGYGGETDQWYYHEDGTPLDRDERTWVPAVQPWGYIPNPVDSPDEIYAGVVVPKIQFHDSHGNVVQEMNAISPTADPTPFDSHEVFGLPVEELGSGRQEPDSYWGIEGASNPLEALHTGITGTPSITGQNLWENATIDHVTGESRLPDLSIDFDFPMADITQGIMGSMLPLMLFGMIMMSGSNDDD